MRKVLFVGPSYPPEWVMKYINDIIINIYTDDSVSSDVVNNAFIRPVIIKELTISNTRVTCTIEYVNPITGEVIEQSTDRGNVTVLTDNKYVNSFHGGPYNISPCCIALTYIKDVPDKPAIVLNCKYPLRCNVEDNTLNITAEEPVLLESGSVLEDQKEIIDSKTSITTLNGLHVTNGEITITGVGTITVTINDTESVNE